MRAILLFLLVCFQTSYGAQAQSLPGRLITFKTTFDGWWDVACDTAPDGTDARCYTQYVDVYVPPPKLRGVMVDFVYRVSQDGRSEPVIMFDIEPGLTFSDDAKAYVMANGRRTAQLGLGHCRSANCVVTGAAARRILTDWSAAEELVWIIRETSGDRVVRTWPLGNVARMIAIMAEQRKLRKLP